MIESSSFGGSLSRLRLAAESRGGWNRGSGYRCEWTHEGKPRNGIFRSLGATQTRALFGARMSVRCIERRNFFYATWVVPQELISCPIKAIGLVGRVFCFIGYTKLKTLLNLNTPL